MLGPFPHRSDLIRSLENVFAETARLGLNPPMRNFIDDGSEDETTVMRRLEILADQMLASLAGQVVQSESEGESDDEDDVSMPPLERINDHRTEDWPLPLMFDSDTDGDMPALASVSDSSDDAPSEDEDSDSSSDDHAEVADDRIQTIRPFDLEFDPGMDARNENRDSGMFVRFSTLFRAAAAREAEAAVSETTMDVSDESEENDGDDESDMPPLEHEPPFVTDGRGRVVWSSSSDSGSHAGSSARRASVTFPGAFPSVPIEKPPSPRQPTGEGGFTTDGRGRVIGTTGTREDENEGGETDESDDAPVQSRSFFGRVFDAFF
ncbi:hypothetical protein C8R44DRAFT_214793 [Mycena epipterygia]|nr:hypothetical protein C8R44DRAFT_214793 [Mycena epipterygia]